MANPVTASSKSLSLDVAERADQRAKKANRNSLLNAVFTLIILAWTILWAIFGPGIMHGGLCETRSVAHVVAAQGAGVEGFRITLTDCVIQVQR